MMEFVTYLSSVVIDIDLRYVRSTLPTPRSSGVNPLRMDNQLSNINHGQDTEEGNDGPGEEKSE
jgi:hypothetical protein